MKRKISGICIIILGIVLLLSSCAAEPLTPDKNTAKVMGSVNGFEVYYDEIWFLAENYQITVNGVTPESLHQIILEKLPYNYSVLSLAKEAGIAYSTDDKELKEEVQTVVDSTIESDFNGNKSDYVEGLHSHYLTDRYFRFLTSVDLVYADLRTDYLTNGIIKADDETVMSAMEDSMFRTVHVMTYTEEEAKKVAEALASGKTMYEMIGSSYNKDYTVTTLDGYYFFEGTMDEAYESATKKLGFGDISPVVSSYASDSDGNRKQCYYIIQRLEPEKEYLNAHFDRFADEYVDLKLSQTVEDYAGNIHFEPNAEYLALDLLNMVPAVEHDHYFLRHFALPIGIVLILVILVIVTLSVKSARRNKKLAAMYGK